MDNKVKKQLFVWMGLLIVCAFVAIRYFQGAYTWPVHDYNRDVQTTIYSAGNTVFLDSRGTILPITSEPTHNYWLAFIKWGLSAFSLLSLWQVVGLVSGTIKGRIGLFFGALVLLAVVSIAVFIKFFFFKTF